MTGAVQDLANGNFDAGLGKLAEDPLWRDDRSDLKGPFRLGFPRAKGWGEDLLAASLLRRTASSENSVQVMTSWQVCEILKDEDSFDAQEVTPQTQGRSPLAILRQALQGDLLEEVFIPIGGGQTHTSSGTSTLPRIGIAWASVSNNVCIPEKSAPVAQFLAALKDINAAEFVSLQRCLGTADPQGLVKRFGARVIEDPILNAETKGDLETLVHELRSLDVIVTISTTIAHIAGSMGIKEQLIAAQRSGQQWFWQVQANYQKTFYPSVQVHLGKGEKNNWWRKPLESAIAGL